MAYGVVVVLVLALMLQWHRYAAVRRVKRWRRGLDLERHEPAFDRLYQPVDGFSLSRQARQDGDAPEFVYGEVEFESFVALLSVCRVDSGTVFYDLGSGVGKAVVACAMVFRVHRSCGLELFSGLHVCAEQQKARLLSLPEYSHLNETIIFKQGNFLDCSLLDATLVFVNASAFFGELWDRISQHLEQVQPGSIVVTTSKALRSSQFVTLKITRVQMSWGYVSAFIQQRRAVQSTPDEIIFSAG